jgi:hypothetical protein
MSYEYIDNTGTIMPDTADIISEVEQGYQDVFGQDLITTPNTPQGLLIAETALTRDSLVRNNAALANQINPNIAGGQFLDAIMALTGDSRSPESFSIVTIDMNGVAGGIIPSGSIISDQPASGNQFVLQSTVTLDATGYAQGIFQALLAGPVFSEANTITYIIDAPLALETVNNPSDSSVGVATQSDISARTGRKNKLALQGSQLIRAMASGIYNTNGVNSLFYLENTSSTTQVIDGVTMVSHSLYFCVDGGADLDVATVMTERKGGGCAYNNGPGINISVPVTDQYSLQTTNVLFDRPNLIPILVRATIRVGQSIDNPEQSVIDAIIAYANGQIDGEDGLVIGENVSCFELSGAVNVQTPEIHVVNMETTIASIIDYSNAEIPINVWEKATVTSSSISVVIV